MTDTEKPTLIGPDGSPVLGQVRINEKENAPQIEVKEEKTVEKFLPMSHFIKECDLDGCYILQKGRLVVRCAFLTNEASTLLGWTYLDVDLIEKLIKRSRKAIRLNKKNSNNPKMKRVK